jgi:tetratricopeptide (TPR) repeat protein
MKRTISLWLGLLAFALLPALAQTPATGKIHGHVTNPTGAPTTVGTVSLSTDGGKNTKFAFTLTATGEYSGEATPGTYTLVFRTPDTPADKMVDSVPDVKIVAGQDVMADIDMSRKAYIDTLTPDQKKQLEEIRKHNSEVMKSNEMVKSLNADLARVIQAVKEADGARSAAAQALGANATRAEIEAKDEEIKTAKYTEIETLMLKDTAVKPDASVLWANLCKGQIGLKKYEEAESACKKALEVEATSKKPSVNTQGEANANLGEIYARTGKIPEANAAYDAAAKANPTQASLYFKNESVIFSQVGNGDAQVGAAEEAIKVDPNQALPYYLKGNGLVQKTAMDAKTHKLVPPPGCLDAYQKYLELAPTGPYAQEVKDILAGFNQTIDNSFKANKKK